MQMQSPWHVEPNWCTVSASIVKASRIRLLVRTVLDIWLPLAMGCATVIAPAEQMKDVDAVRGLIARHGVACMTTVPSMFQVLVCSALN